jgi:hypothetical protein
MNKECNEHESNYNYQASAYAIVGEFRRPKRQSLPIQGATVLSVTGGQSIQCVKDFNLCGLVSFKNAHVEVGGSYDKCHDTFTSYAYSSIEGLNIADMLTADRVVSRIMVYSPQGDYDGDHTFDITGSYFENLKIAGHEINAEMNTGAFHKINSFSKFNDAYCSPYVDKSADADKSPDVDKLLSFNKFNDLSMEKLEELEDQYHALYGLSEVVNKQQKADEAHRKSNTSRKPKDRYFCSALSHLDLKGQFGRSSELENYGEVICIPKFGVIRLGEIVVYKHFRSLTMFKVQMCSTGSGDVNGAQGSGGGGHGLP